MLRIEVDNGRRLAVLLALVLVLVTRHTGTALKCMVRTDLYDAAIVADVCYWAYPPAVERTWTAARTRCATGYGDLAFIASEPTNLAVAQLITAPSFIGYYKNMAGSWAWTSGDAVLYSRPFVDSAPVHVAMSPATGAWTPDFFGISYLTKGFVCSAPMARLRCPSIIVANALASTSAAVRSSETVTYTCSPGYQMTGGVTVMTATCLSNRTWDVNVPNCTIITCDRMSLPAGTVRSTEAFTVGTNVTYSCSASNTYFAPGAPSAGRKWTTTCLPDGVWSSYPPACYVYNCDLPPIVQFTTINSTDVYHGTYLAYKCVAGYKFPESSGSTVVTTKVMQCSANETSQAWIVTGVAMPAACVPITCAAQPLPAFSTADTTSLLALTQVNVWCNKGYYFPDTTMLVQQTICQATSYWSKIIKDCVPRTCPAISVNNATLITNGTTAPYAFGTNLTFKCVGATLFPGGNDIFTTTCNERGEFEPRPPASGCQEGTCQATWSLYGRHCYFVSNWKTGLLRQSAAETSCVKKSGHLVDIMSQEENDFVAQLAGLTVFPVVSGSEYFTGWTFLNDSWQWLYATHGAWNFTNWMEGYPDFPDAYWCSSMSISGQWKDKPCAQMLPYICKKLQVCGLPPLIERGALVASPAPTYGEIGDSLEYSCDNGYAFASYGTPRHTITCLKGGYWSDIESCTLARCPAVTPVTSAMVSTTSTVLGTTVTYTCNPGFVFKNRAPSVSSYCNASLQWSRSVDNSCYAIECPRNQSRAVALYGNLTSIGAMERFTCLPGYIYSDGTMTKQFSCAATGSWAPNSTCQPVACPVYRSSNSTLVVTGKGTNYKDSVKVTCIEGYYMNEVLGTSATVNCTRYATWSQILPPCVRKPCAEIPDVEMANCTLIADLTPLAFSVVNCSCINDTVYISGTRWMTASCHPVSLTWLGAPSRCVDEAIYLQSLNYTVTEAENAVAFGSVGIVMVSVIILGIVLMDVVTLKMHLRSR